MLGLPSYLVAKGLFRGPEHPRGVEALAYWPADWFVTIGTSGLATALASALLAHLAGRLGCSARASVLVGLAYGLATPALVYGELAYGHQVTACCLLGAWALVCAVPTSDVRHLWIRSCVVGFLLALSCVVEYQSAPLGAIVGLAFVLSHLRLPHVGSQLAAFAIGTLPPLFLLAVYNTLAFGSPLDFGYAHHAVPRFSHVHSAANPLGLQPPRWQLLPELLWRPYRGILAYAPVTLLAVPGWLALAQARRWSWLTVAFGVPALALGVNLCYPEWTGGWSTGPRFLLPALPFAMLAVAAAVARWPRFCFTLLAVTAAIGFVINILFQGVGGRIPESLGTTSPQATIRLLDQPLVREVWPMWRGEPLPGWATGGRFTRTALSELRFRVVQSLWGRSGPRESTRVELLAIALAQILAVVLVLRRLKPPRDHATTREAES
jgi:hypothetical protein